MTFHELTICLDLQQGYCSDLENRDMPHCSEQVFCTDTELALRVLAWREGQAGSESACNQRTSMVPREESGYCKLPVLCGAAGLMYAARERAKPRGLVWSSWHSASPIRRFDAPACRTVHSSSDGRNRDIIMVSATVPPTSCTISIAS